MEMSIKDSDIPDIAKKVRAYRNEIDVSFEMPVVLVEKLVLDFQWLLLCRELGWWDNAPSRCSCKNGVE